MVEWTEPESKELYKTYRSLVERTVDAQLLSELIVDYGFPNAIAKSLRDLFMRYFNTYADSEKAEGQIIYRAIPENIPPGIPVREIKTLPVRLTLVHSSDIDSLNNGTAELTRQRIVRLTNEAYDQGGLLTQADLALLLGVCPRTISNRIAELREEGIIVPTRGNKKDIGPGISHKTKIVELYLKGLGFTEVKRRTRHSTASIARYLKDFARVACLYEGRHTIDEIRIITGHSERLIRQYIELRDSLDERPEMRQRYEQLTAKFVRGEKKSPYDEPGDAMFRAIKEARYEREPSDNGDDSS